MPRYRLEYEHYFDTCDEDVGIMSTLCKETFDSESDEQAEVDAHKICDKACPSMMRRWYKITKLVRIEQPEIVTEITLRKERRA